LTVDPAQKNLEGELARLQAQVEERAVEAVAAVQVGVIRRDSEAA
jgi:hypothetical protein